MGEVIAARVVEGCLDGTRVRELELASPIDEALMRRLSEGGTLQYFPHFPRPYFRIDRSGHWVVQGVIGSQRLRVTFLAAAPELEQALAALAEGDGAEAATPAGELAAAQVAARRDGRS